MTGRLEDYPMAHDIEDRVFGAAQLPQDRGMSNATLWRGLSKGSNPVTAPILALIRRAESGDSYDAFFSFRNPTHKPLTEMTLAEVRAYQEGFARAGGASTAAGAYQIIRATFDGLVDDMGLHPATVFNQRTQDEMAVRLLERRGFAAYKAGDISKEAFARRLSKEWASLPIVVTDRERRNPEASYYDGDGLNHARVSVAEVMRALEG